MVLVAILALAVSVATRFTVPAPEIEKVTTVKSQLPDAKRQHLLGNALPWTPPVSRLTFFQPPRSSVLAVSVVVPATNLNSESWLYNRPPPSR